MNGSVLKNSYWQFFGLKTKKIKKEKQNWKKKSTKKNLKKGKKIEKRNQKQNWKLFQKNIKWTKKIDIFVYPE